MNIEKTFKLEKEMTPIVSAWMRRKGMVVKAEFLGPSNSPIDLVGMIVDPVQHEKRVVARHWARIAWPGYANICLELPSMDSGQGMTAEDLCADVKERCRQDETSAWYRTVLEERKRNLGDLVKRRFVVEVAHGQYASNIDWMPLHKQLVAIELKLHRTQEVVYQAQRNKVITDDSYIAMPYTKAKRVLAKGVPANIADFGIGVIGVQKNRCVELLAPSSNGSVLDLGCQMHAVDKLWHHYRNEQKVAE